MGAMRKNSVIDDTSSYSIVAPFRSNPHAHARSPVFLFIPLPSHPPTHPLDQVVDPDVSMCIGEIRKLVVPADLAYGDRGAPPKIPSGATLVFEVELLNIERREDHLDL
eukprot:m.13873 g.13873  ORF g.13873 m.13873 type:complete len:109 (-) comp2877_c0_seq2:112-438(-)